MNIFIIVSVIIIICILLCILACMLYNAHASKLGIEMVCKNQVLAYKKLHKDKI